MNKTRKVECSACKFCKMVKRKDRGLPRKEDLASRQHYQSFLSSL